MLRRAFGVQPQKRWARGGRGGGRGGGPDNVRGRDRCTRGKLGVTVLVLGVVMSGTGPYTVFRWTPN